MRILARKELQQQFVEVEAADERRPADSRQPAAPFGPEQRLQFVLPRPGQQQAAGTLQQAPQFGARAPRAARHHRDPPVIRRDRLHDHARLAVRVGMQHESRLVVAAQRLRRGGISVRARPP